MADKANNRGEGRPADEENNIEEGRTAEEASNREERRTVEEANNREEGRAAEEANNREEGRAAEEANNREEGRRAEEANNREERRTAEEANNREEGVTAEEATKPWLISAVELRNALLVGAVLVATLAFQLVTTPPGGFWQDDLLDVPANDTLGRKNHTAGYPIWSDKNPPAYALFLLCSVIAFILSIVSKTSTLASLLDWKRRRLFFIYAHSGLFDFYYLLRK